MVWVVSLSTLELSPQRLTHACRLLALEVWLRLVTSTWPLAHPALYLQQLYQRGCTCMHFGENQLSPRSLGISPLSTGHPPVLQHWWVQASTECHFRFTLPMDSSRGFGSHHGHPAARFRLGFPLAPELCRSLTCDRDALAGSFYKRHAISPCSRYARVTSDCLEAHGFRHSFIPLAGCFSPFPHGTCSLSLAAGS